MNNWDKFRARSRVALKWLAVKSRDGLNLAVYVAISPYRIFKFVCFSLGFLVLVLSITLSLYITNFLNSLPDLEHTSYSRMKQIARKRVSQKLQVKSKRYKWVGLQNVSRDYLYTIVMSEDAGFFEHDGIDFDAVIDSFAKNFRKRKVESGGSTISQQTVKNLFLKHDRTFARKFKEVIITWSLEKHFSKNQILELYLNIAELGPDIYGINAASYAYFGKSPSKINAAEGAFIGLMLPSPRRFHYSVFQNKNLSRPKRRKIRRILADMMHHEFISPKQFYGYLNYNYFKKRRRAIASKPKQRTKKRRSKPTRRKSRKRKRKR